MKKLFSALVMVMGLLMLMVGSASAHHKVDHEGGPPVAEEAVEQTEEVVVEIEEVEQVVQTEQTEKVKPTEEVEEEEQVEAKKVFVCKYVGKPGVDEVLQTGNNPISVSVNAIKNYAGVGSYFNDAQGRSYVLAEDTRTGGGQEGEPSVSQCPVPTTTTTTPPTTTPPTTTPPTTEPPVTTPPTTEPPVTVPPVTEPPATNPPVLTPPVSVVRPPVLIAPPVTTAAPTTQAPVEETYRLAETGSSDSLPIMALSGLGLLLIGIAMSRKASRI